MNYGVGFSLLVFFFLISSDIGATDLSFVNNLFEVESFSLSDELTQSSKYIPLEEFMYADTRRYILIDDLPLKESDINPYIAGAFGVGLAATFILQHQMQMNTI